jgi:hypothetical protein
MPSPIRSSFFGIALAALCTLPALAQQEEERIDFAGGVLTITENDDAERILAFDGRELARDYFVGFDKITDVGGTDVAFFSVGPGGNACGTSTFLIWNDASGAIQSARAGDECGSPSPAITDTGVFFVPYVLPGASAPMQGWTPEEGLSTYAIVSFTPEPDTTWQALDLEKIGHPVDLFRNAAVYAAAQELLGEALTDTITGLVVSGQPDVEGNILSARGCVPHACGFADTFVVVDKAAKSVFFAQLDDDAGTRFWPERAQWSKTAAALLPEGF